MIDQYKVKSIADSYFSNFWTGQYRQVENLEQKMDGLSEDYANKLAEELKFLSTQTAVLKQIVTENKDEQQMFKTSVLFQSLET